MQAAQVLGNNPNYVSYVPACGVPTHVTALHHRYSTDFPVSSYLCTCLSVGLQCLD